ncbi:Uncharacterised protein [BD1-7 clade bacterium]|uniref:Uncharacterized protein n=1 Tax=BD1-7 clade bacterium TaxID=2029982 RepID=A0A5S9MPX6_9GAMM|nr:Uncharacterised protein [BD1-7 clade bacterium]
MNTTPSKPSIPETHLDILKGSKAIISTLRHFDGHISTHPVIYEWDGEFVRFSTFKQYLGTSYPYFSQNPTYLFKSRDDQSTYPENSFASTHSNNARNTLIW